MLSRWKTYTIKSLQMRVWSFSFKLTEKWLSNLSYPACDSQARFITLPACTYRQVLNILNWAIFFWMCCISYCKWPSWCFILLVDRFATDVCFTLSPTFSALLSTRCLLCNTGRVSIMTRTPWAKNGPGSERQLAATEIRNYDVKWKGGEDLTLVALTNFDLSDRQLEMGCNWRT